MFSHNFSSYCAFSDPSISRVYFKKSSVSPKWDLVMTEGWYCFTAGWELVGRAPPETKQCFSATNSFVGTFLVPWGFFNFKKSTQQMAEIRETCLLFRLWCYSPGQTAQQSNLDKGIPMWTAPTKVHVYVKPEMGHFAGLQIQSTTASIIMSIVDNMEVGFLPLYYSNDCWGKVSIYFSTL